MASSSSGAGGIRSSFGIDVSSIEAKKAIEDAKEVLVSQEQSMEKIDDTPDFVNPAAASRASSKSTKFKTLIQRRKSSTESTPEEKIVVAVEEKEEEDLAEHEEHENPELEARKLRELTAGITPDLSVDDILKQVQALFPDPALTVKALDYLIATVPPEQSVLKNLLIRTQSQFIAMNPRAIKGQANVLFASQLFAASVNQSPSTLRNLYTEVTGSVQTHQQMFTLLSASYSLPEIKTIAKFLLRGMSADIRSDGSSIEKAKLKVLMAETLTLQSVLRTYSFFEFYEPILQRSFRDEGIEYPSHMDAKMLAKAFTDLVQDKMLTSDKVKKTTEALVGNNRDAQTCIINAFFQGLRQTAPRLFKSAQHRQEIQLHFTNTLDKLNVDNPEYPHPENSPLLPKGIKR